MSEAYARGLHDSDTEGLSPLGQKRLEALADGASLSEVQAVLSTLDEQSQTILDALLRGVDKDTILQSWTEEAVMQAGGSLRSALESSSGISLVATPSGQEASDEATTEPDYDPQEIAKWFNQINRFSKGDYLSEIGVVGSATIYDEVIGLLALYAQTRVRQVGVDKSLTFLNDSLVLGSAKAAKVQGISVANASTKRSQAAKHIAEQLDGLHGLAVKEKTTTGERALGRATRSKEPRESVPTTDASYVGDDHLKIHLQSISKVALLTAEQEVELAKRIEAGLVAEAVLSGDAKKALSGKVAQLGATSEELEWLSQDGQEAYTHFIAANPRLAVSIAKKYTHTATPGFQFEDMIQAGTEGVIRAVQKFDYKKGYKFSTYASWWIRQAITRARADEGRTIRIPVHATEELNAIRREQRKFIKEHEREPSDEEIGFLVDMSAIKVRELLQLGRDPVSLHAPIGDDGTEFGHLLPGEDGTDMFAALAQASVSSEIIRKTIDSLPAREADVIRRRYGFTGRRETLDSIALKYGVTRERIRQVEGQAMGHLGRLFEGLVVANGETFTPKRYQRGRKPSYDILALIEQNSGSMSDEEQELLRTLHREGSQVAAGKVLGLSSASIAYKVKKIRQRYQQT